jgi:hypothetical protein
MRSRANTAQLLSSRTSPVPPPFKFNDPIYLFNSKIFTLSSLQVQLSFISFSYILYGLTFRTRAPFYMFLVFDRWR